MGARASNQGAKRRPIQRGGGDKTKFYYFALAQVAKWVEAQGGDEATYRAALARHGAKVDPKKGYHSATTMSEAQMEAVLVEFEEEGFVRLPQRGGGRRPSAAPRAKGHVSDAQVKKIHALWSQLADLEQRYPGRGVKSRAKTALGSWIGRQIGAKKEGVATAPEMLAAGEAHRIIEELKGWIGRIINPRLASLDEALRRHPSGPRGWETRNADLREHQYLSSVATLLAGER